MSWILEAQGVSKIFSKPAHLELFRDIHLKIAIGESVAITGASGSGKSTLMHLLGTLEAVTSGSLFLGGEKVHPWNRVRLRRDRTGFIFQAFHLLEEISGLDNVLMAARVARQGVAPGSWMRERALQLLEQVGLKDRMLFTVKLLSGGEKQRVALARAFLRKPDLIFADEPSGNLDRHNAQVVHEMLLNYVREEHKSLVLVTHDLALARLCDTHYRLEKGALTRCAPLAEGNPHSA